MLGWVTMRALHRPDMGRVSCTCRVVRQHLLIVVRCLSIIKFEVYQGSCDSRKRLKAQLVPKPITMQGQKYDCDRMCAHCGWLTSNVITEGGCSMCLWYDLCDDCKRQCKGTGELLCLQCPEDYTLKEKDFQCPRDYRSTRERLILKYAVWDVHDLFESTGMWHPSNVKRYGRPAEHPLGSYMHVA